MVELTEIKTGDEEWNRRFMNLASEISKWSKDPSTKVGAVIVDENRRVVSTGYNGFPKGTRDFIERLEDSEMKYRMVLHAEENAIMFAKQNLEGCSLYVTSMPPCSHCAALIIQSGIKKVYAQNLEIPDRWKNSVELTNTMFLESGVSLELI